METTAFKELSSKLILIHEDLRELINISKTQKIDETKIIETLKRELKISFNIVDEQQAVNSQELLINSSQDINNVRKSIISLWKRKLNERKQNFWNFLKSQNTVIIYETWLGKEMPVIPRKLRPKTIPGEHTDDINIRRENAIRNFEVEIKLLKNKANRYEHNYKKMDEEMYETFVAKFNAEITESINNLWRSDCEKEEIKSVQIWERKQLWLEEYEDHFGDLFVTEENTQVDNAYKKKTFPRKERKVLRNYPGTSHNTDDNLTNQAVVHVSHTPHTNIQPRNKPKTKRTEPFFRTTQDERQRGRDNRPQYTEPNSIISQHELRGDIPEGNSLTNTEKIHPRIINLSHRKLQLREINLLKRGLKFTPTPNEDKTQLGADIDEFGRRLRINYIFCKDNEENEEEENKPLVRNKSDWIPRPTKDKDLEETIKTLKTNSLTSNKNVKDNLTREEKTALQNLKSDKSIIIKEADKGNAVVIMDREYYRDSILNMLQDEMSYEVTDKKLDRQTSTMIKKLLKKHETELFKEEIDYISNSKFSESYFYGLPKIHKSEEISNAISEQNSEYIELLTPNDLKFRPIVGGPNSVTQNLSHFIDIVLKPLCREVPSFIRDDLEFLNHLPKTVNPNSELITFDIVSLYTNIPHDLGITAVKYWLENTENVIENRLTKEFILASLKLILERNIFYFNGTYYHQKKGTAMGTKMAPSYATLECKVHNRKLDFYCFIHNEPCCVSCVSEKHDACKSLNPLTEVVEAVKSSASFKDLEDMTTDISELIGNLIKDIQDNKASFKFQKNGIRSEVQKVRKTINNNLDKNPRQFFGKQREKSNEYNR
ncbi:unnamed protein product [Mytilus edulis]|uniref:Reverse transcriptase domain-containing protein n=1 Tax=Mytilus edulis TaxID=6550 RepID=A0A8S3V0K2_MYTED|nr:unnamed protein product [Mytilus edulis]